jgi:hypothetical protein
MPEPQEGALSVLKSILLSQGQFIYHGNALYIGVEMVMCHALICVKEIHQPLT